MQEALTNVVKHAHAQHVEIALARDGGEVRVSVADDGRGFEPAAPRDGFGLVGLAERAKLVGGHAEVTSSPAGTTVRATIPAHRRAVDVVTR